MQTSHCNINKNCVLFPCTWKKVFKYIVHRLIDLIPVYLTPRKRTSHINMWSYPFQIFFFFLLTEVKYYKVEVLFPFLISSPYFFLSLEVTTIIILVKPSNPHFYISIKYALLQKPYRNLVDIF